MKKFNTKSLLLLGVLFFMMSSVLKAQTSTLNPPQLDFSEACVSAANPSVKILLLSYSGTPINDNFIVRLSDANGDFANGRDIKTIPNADFNDNGNPFALKNVFVQMPTDVNGGNYRIQLRTSGSNLKSSPGVTPGGASSFPAYYKTNLTNLNFLVDGVKDTTGVVGICEGESKVISLDMPSNNNATEYKWYKNGAFLTTASTPSLTVSEKGRYEVQIDYKACGNSRSKSIVVGVFSASAAQIKGPTTIQACASEIKTLEATVNDPSYTYEWFRGTQKVGTNSYQYTTTGTTEQFGEYHVKITANGCSVNSNKVAIVSKTESNFNIVANSPLNNVLLPGEGVVLSIKHSATSAKVEWYKEGSPTPTGITDVVFSVFDSGVYYAKVTDTSSPSCLVVKESPRFTVVKGKALSVVVNADANYKECTSLEVTLKAIVKIVGVDDKEYDITSNQSNSLTYQWLKKGKPISSLPGRPSTSKAFIVSSYTNNDEYSLKVSKNSLEGISSPFNVLLTAGNPELRSSSLSNALCNVGETITLTLTGTIEGFLYKWFKDSNSYAVTDSLNVQVSEVGLYSVTMIGFGCEKVIGAIEIKQFDDSAVTITPSEKVTLVQGETAVATASGADSYEWFDKNNVSQSSTNVLEATKEGVYTLVASVGNCNVRKTIEVVPEDGVVIVPNILSPNGDGINDTWELSNRYSFSSDTQIFIYNSNGKEVYNTSDYKNNWPTEDIGNQKIFYYKIIKSDAVVKAGTISILD